MMNVIEVLETDHIAIRLINKCIGIEIDPGSFKTFHDFVVNLHAKIEDEILFPTMNRTFSSDEDILYIIDRISKDHKLLETLGNNIIKYGEEGNIDLYKKRLERYFIILVDHNNSEEKLLFPLYRDINREMREKADKAALEIINEYGYHKCTSIIRIIGGEKT